MSRLYKRWMEGREGGGSAFNDGVTTGPNPWCSPLNSGPSPWAPSEASLMEYKWLNQVAERWIPRLTHDSSANLRETSKAWHCAIVPFITVAHIHIKHILTFSLIFEKNVYFSCLFLLLLRVPSSLSLLFCPYLSPAGPTYQDCTTCPHPLICCSNMAPTVIFFLQQGGVFCLLQTTSFL